ncbi:hypothetical protein MMYC01_209592 [Madurella mycetomatis]|uniref:Uncharacterized protein n=1 Tax=Madurella mycetomatis TaxID=100816 RepID=A0A175VPB0_9PEZI|nr:hypothetical protein MMYC01_209592 [Madurella mycetomatis]
MSNREVTSSFGGLQDNSWQEIMEAQEADRADWIKYMAGLGLGEVGGEGMKQGMGEETQEPLTLAELTAQSCIHVGGATSTSHSPFDPTPVARPSRMPLKGRDTAVQKPGDADPGLLIGHLVKDKDGPSKTPPEDNCKFLITGLPPNISIRSLLRHIRNVGRIYTTRIMKPESSDDTATASVIFFDVFASKRFHNMYENAPLTIRGYDAKVACNHDARIANNLPRNLSRVILVWGPRDQVEVGKLLMLFRRNFSFRLDNITTVVDSPATKCLEISFGSWRGEAEVAFRLLRQPLARQAGVSVAYTTDPCDLGRAPPKGN